MVLAHWLQSLFVRRRPSKRVGRDRHTMARQDVLSQKQFAQLARFEELESRVMLTSDFVGTISLVNGELTFEEPVLDLSNDLSLSVVDGTHLQVTDTSGLLGPGSESVSVVSSTSVKVALALTAP
jgi:hypothetical protein